LRVTIQDLGWKSEGKYLPLMDDISSVSFWYQTEPLVAFPKLPEKDQLESTEGRMRSESEKE
jgi:hypothetical protein